ncbi:MAG: class IIb bacteriocin, lactobin A/cerein 7B family [Bacilli bacterium]|nr:class IIb bacteriocin, lactobin A/cerein 7B family [Bacilli bacterium]
MYQLTNEELSNIKGGISFWGGLAIAGTIIFIIGVIDGIVRPLKCN